MNKRITIKVSAEKYEGSDDCLAAAERGYVDSHQSASGYDLNARWDELPENTDAAAMGDGTDRNTILLDVPEFSLEGDEDFAADYYYAVRGSQEAQALATNNADGVALAVSFTPEGLAHQLEVNGVCMDDVHVLVGYKGKLRRATVPECDRMY